MRGDGFRRLATLPFTNKPVLRHTLFWGNARGRFPQVLATLPFTNKPVLRHTLFRNQPNCNDLRKVSPSLTDLQRNPVCMYRIFGNWPRCKGLGKVSPFVFAAKNIWSPSAAVTVPLEVMRPVDRFLSIRPSTVLLPRWEASPDPS
jgi:hypothetical protein